MGRWQLVELGFGAEGIKGALASGRLHPLHREAYAVGHRIVVRRGKWLAAVLAPWLAPLDQQESPRQFRQQIFRRHLGRIAPSHDHPAR